VWVDVPAAYVLALARNLSHALRPDFIGFEIAPDPGPYRLARLGLGYSRPMGRPGLRWQGSDVWRQAVRESAIVLVSSVALATCTAQACAQADSAVSITFEKVWLRNERNRLFRPYSVGTLVVSPAVVSFRSAKAVIEIPVDSIRAARKAKKD
jgi:hypothetical protein